MKFMNKTKKSKINNFDFVIIGAGTFGILSIYLLSKMFSKKKIIIIEKGSEKLKKEINFYKNIGLKHSGLKNHIYSGLGGTSNVWGGQLVEYLKQDFENENYNQNYWGLKYQLVKKLYVELYSVFNLSKKTRKKNQIIQRYKNFRIEKTYTRWLKSSNIYQYLKDKINLENITFLKNTQLESINFEKKLCKNIVCFNKTKRIIINGKKFIFCLGTFNTIKFFLENKSNTPWNKNNNIGKYFHDHFGINVSKIKVINKKKFLNFFSTEFIDYEKYHPKLLYVNTKKKYSISAEIRSVKSNFELNNFKTLFKKLTYKLNFNDLIKLIILSLRMNIKLIIPFYHLIIQKKIKPDIREKLYLYLQCQQSKPYKSNLYINNKSKFILNWQKNTSDMNFINEFKSSLKKYFFKNKICDLFDIKENIIDTNHPSGGMIISSNKNKGVVDKNLKVWDTKNVYVTGLCVLPKSSYANSTFTAMALTLKMIKSFKYEKKIN